MGRGWVRPLASRWPRFASDGWQIDDGPIGTAAVEPTIEECIYHVADQRLAQLGHVQRLAAGRGDELQSPPVASQLAVDLRPGPTEPLVRPRQSVAEHRFDRLHHRLAGQLTVG